MKAELHPLIVMTERDGDGFWIYLKPGYQIDGDHAIVESTRRAAYRKLGSVRMCDCSSCKAEWQARAFIVTQGF